MKIRVPKPFVPTRPNHVSTQLRSQAGILRDGSNMLQKPHKHSPTELKPALVPVKEVLEAVEVTVDSKNEEKVDKVVEEESQPVKQRNRKRKY